MTLFTTNPSATLPLSGAETVPGTQGAGDVKFTLQDIANLFKGTAGANLASAATVNLGAATGNFVHITGTTTITAFDNVAAGIMRWVVFDGALTLTHNATSLILAGAANILTEAGDSALFVSEGSGNWRCLIYRRATGKATVPVNKQSVTSAATVTPTFDNDEVIITAQAAALALANPTGTAIDGWGIVIRIKDNGTARAITYGTQYRAIGVTLPSTTVVNKTLYLSMVYNAADTKWDVVGVAQEA